MADKPKPITNSLYDIKTKTGDNGCDEPIVIKFNDIDQEMTLNGKGEDFEHGNVDSFQVYGPLIKQKAPDDPMSKHIWKLTIVSGPYSGDYWDVEWIYVYSHSEKRQYLFSHDTGFLHPVQVTIEKCPYELSPIAWR